MKTIVVASKNPVKISAALKAFQLMFPHETFAAVGVAAASGVSDQPKSDTETLLGATNRVNNAATLSVADFWVGLEGGIEMQGPDMAAFAWIVVKDANGKMGKGKTGTFFLPQKVAELVQQGKELGEADDIVFGRSNSKQAGGACGLLTGDVVSRTSFYTDAGVLALIPFKNENLY